MIYLLYEFFSQGTLMLVNFDQIWSIDKQTVNYNFGVISVLIKSLLVL